MEVLGSTELPYLESLMGTTDAKTEENRITSITTMVSQVSSRAISISCAELYLRDSNKFLFDFIGDLSGELAKMGLQPLPLEASCPLAIQITQVKAKEGGRGFMIRANLTYNNNVLESWSDEPVTAYTLACGIIIAHAGNLAEEFSAESHEYEHAQA